MCVGRYAPIGDRCIDVYATSRPKSSIYSVYLDNHSELHECRKASTEASDLAHTLLWTSPQRPVEGAHRGVPFTMSSDTMPQTQPASADERSVKILAKSVYKQLKQSGASRAEIVGFTNAMLELVTSEIRDSHTPDA